MRPTSIEPGLPLLIVVEGENDVRFLTAISTILHRLDSNLPDLARLVSERRAIFLPTGGSNLNEWTSRVASLHKRTFFLFDREQEPETTVRRQVVDAVNDCPGCCAVLTKKRAVENYLHPLAILEACGIDLSFDDDTDVASSLALKMLERSGGSSWHEQPYKRQKRLHDKTKRILNVKAVQMMTPALLYERDLEGEIPGWLQTIRRMIVTN
jgi:hypothetical protein